MMISRRGISLALASVAAAAAIAVPAFAMASGGGSAATTLTEPVVVQQAEGETDEDGKSCRGRHHRGERGAALAEALSIDVETLRAAAEAAKESLGDRPDEVTPEVRDERRAAFVSALAVELGVSESEITDAMAELRADRLVNLSEKLAEAVENGRITQEEADEILESIENGERPDGFRGRFHHGPRGGDTSETTGQSA